MAVELYSTSNRIQGYVVGILFAAGLIIIPFQIYRMFQIKRIIEEGSPFRAIALLGHP